MENPNELDLQPVNVSSLRGTVSVTSTGSSRSSSRKSRKSRSSFAGIRPSSSGNSSSDVVVTTRNSAPANVSSRKSLTSRASPLLNTSSDVVVTTRNSAPANVSSRKSRTSRASQLLLPNQNMLLLLELPTPLAELPILLLERVPTVPLGNPAYPPPLARKPSLIPRILTRILVSSRPLTLTVESRSVP